VNGELVNMGHWWNYTDQWLTEGGGVQPPPTPEIPKAFQNRAKLNPNVKTVKNG